MSFVFDSNKKYSHTVYNCVKCYAKIKEQVCNCHENGEKICICPVIRQCRRCNPSNANQKFIHNGKDWVPVVDTICDCGKIITHVKLSPAYAYRCKDCPIDMVHNSVQKVKEQQFYVIYRIIKNHYYDPIAQKHFPKDGPPNGLAKKSNCLCAFH